MVNKAPGTTFFLLPNTQHADGLNLPVDTLPFASHVAWLLYPTNDLESVSTGLTTGSAPLPGWSYVELAGWHVTFNLASASPALRHYRVPLERESPTPNDQCSLNWLPWMYYLTAGWPKSAGSFDSTVLADSLAGGPTAALLTSRVVFLPPNEADVFVGAFRSHDGGARPCFASLGTRVRALPKSIGVVMAVDAGTNYEVLFRDIADKNATPLKLTLKAPASGEQQLYVSQHPVADSRNDFIAHFGLRKAPPEESAYYTLPCSQAPYPLPTCCQHPGPNDNPQCSPVEHEYP